MDEREILEADFRYMQKLFAKHDPPQFIKGVDSQLQTLTEQHQVLVPGAETAYMAVFLFLDECMFPDEFDVQEDLRGNEPFIVPFNDRMPPRAIFMVNVEKRPYEIRGWIDTSDIEERHRKTDYGHYRIYQKDPIVRHPKTALERYWRTPGLGTRPVMERVPRSKEEAQARDKRPRPQDS